MPRPENRNDRPRRSGPPKGRKGPSSGARRGKPERRSQETDWSEKPDWGGVARRGAARVDPKRGRTSGIAPPRSRPEESADGESDAVAVERVEVRPQAEEWILESVEVEAHDAVRRGGRRSDGGSQRAKRGASRSAGGDQATTGKKSPSGSSAVATHGLFDGLGSAQRAELLQKRLQEASRAYGRERYGDALKVLRPLVRDASGVAEVRELAGLCYYRLGRWKDALRELKAFTTISGSTEQYPVLADCARALQRYREVENYWEGLREASPSADLVAEGRIVMAGSLADQGRLDEAVALMESGRRKVSKPKERHLRMAYVLADLQERAGDLPAARSGFAWLQMHDPEFGDVADRLASLH